MHPFVFSVFTLYPDIFKNEIEQEEEKHMRCQFCKIRMEGG